MKQKYNNKKIHAFGRSWDSKGEYERALRLMEAEKFGIISDLRYQIPYPIVINGIKICKYIADFVYKKGDVEIVEDYKGMILPIFKIKMKLLKAVHGIDIKISTSKNDKI